MLKGNKNSDLFPSVSAHHPIAEFQKFKQPCVKMIAWGNANKYALLFVIFYSSQHNIFVATTINQNQPISISVCLFLNTRQLMYILYLPPCSRSLCSVASFHMQVHLARDSVVLTAEWPNRVPRARPSVQGPQRPSPYPAYLLQFI